MSDITVGGIRLRLGEAGWLEAHYAGRWHGINPPGEAAVIWPALLLAADPRTERVMEVRAVLAAIRDELRRHDSQRSRRHWYKTLAELADAALDKTSEEV